MRELRPYTQMITHRTYGKPLKISKKLLRNTLSHIVPFTREQNDAYHNLLLNLGSLELWHFTYKKDPHPFSIFDVSQDSYCDASSVSKRYKILCGLLHVFAYFFNKKKYAIFGNIVRGWLKDLWLRVQEGYGLEAANRATLSHIFDTPEEVENFLLYFNAKVDKVYKEKISSFKETDELSILFDLRKPSTPFTSKRKIAIKELFRKIDVSTSNLMRQAGSTFWYNGEFYLKNLSAYSNPHAPFDIAQIHQILDPRLFQHVYEIQKANQKIAKANTKTKGEIFGSNKKPWKQKGTGRARAGSTKSPLWKGGGVAFGPKAAKQKDIKKFKLNKKVLLQALYDALCYAFLNENLEKPARYFIFNQRLFFQNFRGHKTKAFNIRLKKLGVNSKAKTLMVVSNAQANQKKAAANIKNFKLIAINQLRVIDVIDATNIYLSVRAWLVLLNAIWKY